VISYNPGYQTVLKGSNPNIRQRFVAIEFYYPSAKIEEKLSDAPNTMAKSPSGASNVSAVL
jgi:MoxR-like ATPase